MRIYKVIIQSFKDGKDIVYIYICLSITVMLSLFGKTKKMSFPMCFLTEKPFRSKSCSYLKLVLKISRVSKARHIAESASPCLQGLGCCWSGQSDTRSGKMYRVWKPGMELLGGWISHSIHGTGIFTVIFTVNLSQILVHIPFSWMFGYVLLKQNNCLFFETKRLKFWGLKRVLLWGVVMVICFK